MASTGRNIHHFEPILLEKSETLGSICLLGRVTAQLTVTVAAP